MLSMIKKFEKMKHFEDNYRKFNDQLRTIRA